ncbi:Lipase [Quillaja saponaria]|uniref:Lipase n=1 Tax=Quillaja saponaria TaxID=32244 RepID=A0AAD7PJR4_QUISA|nr:Lipase [Quillaja saponaria]KAJ7958168.1 Lipase [Quillaja saponaria]
MASNELYACHNYLLLNPKETSWFDLVRLLASSKIEKRKFIEYSLDQRDDLHDLRKFQRRWLIFISLLVQKLLIAFHYPMAQIGNLLEMWLNLLSTNGGLLGIFSNLLRGKKLVMPDRLSAEFRSVVGISDTRVELDECNGIDDTRYRVFLSMMAAKISYENKAFVQATVKNHWKMDLLGYFNFWNYYQDLPSTQAIVVQDTRAEPNLIVVAFRGTEPFGADAWMTDIDISWYELENVGKIHGGFMKALGLQKNKGWPKEIDQSVQNRQYAYYAIRQMMKDILEKNESAKFIFTGHSLGGALAVLFVALLAFHAEELLLERLEGVYTFGQPRVGDKIFGHFMNEKMKKYTVRYIRHVYCNDIVPRVPFDDKTLFFKHFGHCLQFNSLYHGKVVWEEPNKNYFSVLWVIPKYLNAVWEIIRSFIIPYILGKPYREGWFMKLFRLVGLVIPGLPAHLPQDYVNATRLGFFHRDLELLNPQTESKDD